MKRLVLVFVFAIAVIAVPQAGRAQAPAVRAEARERFARGLRLYNDGDDSGALAELRRAYALIPNIHVLFNIGLVYAQMGRAVEAAETLDQVLSAPSGLSEERIAVARQVRDEQAVRLAEVVLETGAEDAAIEVDGIEVGKTPLGRPLRVTSGTHVIGVVAPGFSPQRKEITISRGEKQSLRFELVALEGRLAHLAVKTHLPGADLFVDDQRIASTPLAATVTLAPGHHRVELRRAGYTTTGSDVALADGAAGEVTLEPDEERAALATDGGLLALDISEPQSVVNVDGRARGPYAGPLRLAYGPHHVLVERGDFEPFERDAVVQSGLTTKMRVALEPTPDYRARFVSHAQSLRTWAIVSAVAGTAVLAGGIGLAVYDGGQRSSGTAAYNSLSAQTGPGQLCATGQVAMTFQQNCTGPSAAAVAQIDDANTRDYFAWGAVGVGAAALGLGVTLLIAGDNPYKYEGTPVMETVERVQWLPQVWAAAGGAGVGVTGSF